MGIYFENVHASASKLHYQIDEVTSGGTDTAYEFSVVIPGESFIPSEDFRDLADAFAVAVADAINTYNNVVLSTVTRRYYDDVGASTPVTTL